ncbi:MAG: hypothetical protein AAF841_10405 [Pseudomonadota bacterium]
MAVRFKHFARDIDGAVTVDWVVLTAAIVGLGVAIIGVLANGTTNAGDTVDTELSEIASRVATGTVIPD